MNRFGDFLYTLRKEKGMTQAELAEVLGVTNKAVSKWETGESMPETGLLLPISRIFGVTVDELLNGEREASAQSGAQYGEQRDAQYGTQYSAQCGTQYDAGGERDKDECGQESDCARCDRAHEHFCPERHLFTRGKDGGERTRLERIKGAVCTSLTFIGLLVYFIIGGVTDVWHPYWVFIPCFALASGIVGIVFDLCDAKTRERKLSKGENPYTGAICGIIMLSCIIVYVMLGALKGLWHPYWAIPAAGATACTLIGAIGDAISKGKK